MNEYIIDKIMNPSNQGKIENADAVGTVGKVSCWDITRIYLKIDNGIITDAKFKTYGCGISIAAASIGTDMIIGKTIEEASKITNEDVLKELNGGKELKFHCTTLIEDAIKDALLDYSNKNNIVIKGLKMPLNKDLEL